MYIQVLNLRYKSELYIKNTIKTGIWFINIKKIIPEPLV